MESTTEFEPQARRYSEPPSNELRLEDEIRRRPLGALTLAAAAGFILAGGPRSRLGAALTLLAIRTLVRSAAFEFLSGVVGEHAGRQYF